MGNQGSPNPSFFFFDDFTPFVVMACFASLRCADFLDKVGVRASRANLFLIDQLV